MHTAPRPTEPAPAPAPCSEPARTPGSDSYWLSSLELRRGLDVEMVAVRAVPTPVLRELLRLRQAWRSDARARAELGRALALPPAAPPPAPLPHAMDIAFDADGQVTVPGELLPAAA